MELAFGNRAITLADRLPIECLLPARRPRGGGRAGCRMERLERKGKKPLLDGLTMRAQA